MVSLYLLKRQYLHESFSTNTVRQVFQRLRGPIMDTTIYDTRNNHFILAYGCRGFRWVYPNIHQASLAADCSNPDKDASFALTFAASISYDFWRLFRCWLWHHHFLPFLPPNLGKTLKWLNTLENTRIYRVYHAYIYAFKYIQINI